MKVFIYERVSSEEQAKYGYSLDAQHEALTEFCKANDHIIVGEYKDEGISGRKPYTKRPAMLQLLNDLEKVKPDMILFTKLDRWFRNIKEYYKVQDILERNKVDWKAIQEEYDTSTASGRLYINIKLSIAQDEADRTGERVKAVHRQLAMQGKVLGRSVPFGYKVVDKRVVFSEDIDAVKDALEHYMLHGSKMQSNIKEASKTRTFLFTGLMKCPKCGRRLSGTGDMYDHKYYRCMKRYYGLCDFDKYISEKKLEAWLLENIEEDFKVNVTMKPKQKKESPQKYKDRLARLNEMYLMGTISQDEYKEKSATLLKQIADLSKNTPVKTQNFASNWKEVYHKLDEEHKRSFWHSLLQQIVVNEDLQVVEVLY